MKLAIAMLVFLSTLAASAAPVRAQEQTQVRHRRSEQRSAELAKWLKDTARGRTGLNSGETESRNLNNDQIWTQEASRASCLARGRMPG